MCEEGYGDVFDFVFGPERSDGLSSAGVWPLSPFLFLVAHGHFHTGEHLRC